MPRQESSKPACPSQRRSGGGSVPPGSSQRGAASTRSSGGIRRQPVASGQALAGDSHPSSKSSHGPGSVEYAYVLDGAVTVASGDWTVELNRGDGLRFSAEQEHVYTGGPAGARVLTVVAFSDE